MRREVAADLRAIFESLDRLEVERRWRQTLDKYARSASKLSVWLETNLAESFTVFAFPKTHRRRSRTSNLMERISKELTWRTRVATLFPNYLVSAVSMEISERCSRRRSCRRLWPSTLDNLPACHPGVTGSTSRCRSLYRRSAPRYWPFRACPWRTLP